MTWEIIVSLNSVVRDWLLIQKSIKIKQIGPDFVGRAQNYVSKEDCQKIVTVLESMKPVICIDELRIARLTGQKYPGGKIDPAVLRDNITVTYDVLKAKTASGQENYAVMDQTIYTVEAAYEAIRRLTLGFGRHNT